MPNRHAASPYQPTLPERCEIAKEHGRYAAQRRAGLNPARMWSRGGTLKDKWWIIANDARGYPVLITSTGEPPIVQTKAECNIMVGRPPDFQLDESMWASYPSKRECKAWYQGLLEGEPIEIDRTTYADEWD